MRILITAIAIMVCLVLIAIATTVEGAFAIVFGWIPFLWRVLPEVQPDGPSLLVGAVALLLFGAGVHLLGRSRRAWRFRWTAAFVLGSVLLFTAGISIVGVSHQIAWLSTSDQPMVSQGVTNRQYGKQMVAMGLTDHHDMYRTLPPGGTFSENGEMLHSWETHILLGMGYTTHGIDMKRPWNAPENQKYFQCVIREFISTDYRTPPLKDGEGYGLSHYAANSRVLGANTAMKLTELPNGTSNTILVGEVNAGYKPWGHPVNWRDPTAGLNRGSTTFGGPPGANGVNFVMADGSIRFVRNSADPSVLRGLSGIRGTD